ncbi:Ig-like domain-containing protein [Gallibacterium genomosp. 1]|uniref:Ig-like domain-containing protein n=1 Tax=Gallibacterium genomosp. 1 TaxID=155515 RepID=UPI0012E78602|nr:Ig-like domain-containing protein [Gallibacterium genomosp. 1]
MARDHPIRGGVESTKITAAKDAVKAAEEAYQQAKNLLDKAKEDNQITAEEESALKKANQAIEDAKTKAEEALKNLPKEKQEELKEKLDAVNPIEIPENGGNSSTGSEPTTPKGPTGNQDSTGTDKPDVGGQDKDPDTTKPAAPTDLHQDNSGMNTVISGKAEPNSKVVIKGKEYDVNGEGEFTADLGEKLDNGVEVKVKAKDAAGNESPETAITVDTTAPAAPTDLHQDNSGTNTVISGKAEPNSKVVIKGKEYDVNGEGEFTADLGEKLDNGVEVKVKAKDAAGNESPETAITIDIKPLAFDSESKTPAASVANGDKVILNLNGKAESDHPADTFDGNRATLIFGDAIASNEKVHTLTGTGNNGRIKVYNPKLDWDMRTSDDGTGAQRDHAPGWGYDEEALKQDAIYNSYNPNDYRAYFYKWTGASDAADIILVENVQTDPDNGDTKVQGMIVSEAKGAETKQVRFALDTLGGGNDYIKAKGVGGHVKIKTNDGDDVIELGYMNGRKGVGVPYYDGSNQIDMGDGNDKLLVTSHSGDQGVWQNLYDNGSLYYTNAKIDMGEGNNEVSISHNIIAGAEDGSGNYIRFGGGNDKLTVGGYIGGESASIYTGYKSSNIIDLGGGHNTVQVKGGLYQRDTTKFLMVSNGSSEVTFGNGIGGRSSMMMGDGADTVVVNGNAEFNSEPYYWLDGAFIKNMEEGAKNDMYKGFYETAFKQKVSDKLVSAIDRAGAGSESVLGAKGLNPNETNMDNARNIGTRIDLGAGENTLSISGSVLRLNYIGGADSDAVTLGATSESRFWMGDGTNTLSLGSSSSVGYSGGTGTDTITINSNVNNSTFNIGSGDNSITIRGNAEQTWIGMSNNDQGFAQSGNDTVTIGGSFTGKGIETEVINLGAGQDSVTISGELRESLIRMGDGNDSITIRGITYDSNRIDAGNGDDVITVTNQINSTNTHLIGGEGNDTFTVQYFRGDNQNAVAGGAGKDTLNIIGNNNQFIVGYRSGWTNLWSIEEIVFKGTSGRNTIRIDEKSLTEDNNKSLYIKNQSTGSNTVDVNAKYSSKSSQTLHEDRDSNGQDEAYSYTVYKFDGGYTLYIENGINIT